MCHVYLKKIIFKYPLFLFIIAVGHSRKNYIKPNRPSECDNLLFSAIMPNGSIQLSIFKPATI